MTNSYFVSYVYPSKTPFTSELIRNSIVSIDPESYTDSYSILHEIERSICGYGGEITIISISKF